MPYEKKVGTTANDAEENQADHPPEKNIYLSYSSVEDGLDEGTHGPDHACAV